MKNYLFALASKKTAHRLIRTIKMEPGAAFGKSSKLACTWTRVASVSKLKGLKSIVAGNSLTQSTKISNRAVAVEVLINGR